MFSVIWSAILLGPVVVLLALVYLFLVFRAPSYPKGVPHPEGYPLIGNTVLALRDFGNGPDMLVQRAEECGSKTWCSSMCGQPLTFYTVDVRNVEHMLKTNFSGYEKGPEFRNRFHDLLGEGIFNVDGDEWYMQRKTASRMFNVRNFRDSMLSVFVAHGEKLRNRLREAAASGEEIDIQDLYYRFTLDSIGVIGFGVDFHSLDGESEFARAFDGAQSYIVTRFLTPLWSLRKYYSPHEWHFQRQVLTLKKFALEIVKERRRDSLDSLKSRSDILSIFMSHAGQEFSDSFLVDLVLNFTIAGRDTTAQALSWMTYLLAKNPLAEERLVKEVNEVLGSEDPSYETLKSLTYTENAFIETLRLYPSVPVDGKMAVEDDVLPDGTVVPQDAFLYYVPYVMGRREELWKDAKSFKPERWTEEENLHVSPFKFTAFQAGPRTCLGKNMAIIEGKTIAAMVFREFRIRVAPGQGEVRPQSNVTLPVNNGLKVLVVERS